MKHDKVASSLGTVDELVEELKIKLDDNAEIVQQMNLVRAFIADERQLTPNDLYKKWDNRFFDYYKAQLSIGVLSHAITELVKNQKVPLGKYMKVVLGGSLTQGGPAGGQPRDWFYELWLASVLSETGFTIQLQEPDLVVEGNGLSHTIGIACKYPSSAKGIHQHLSKGLSQLKKHSLPGFIALGIDQIVVDKANLKKYVDFNRGGKNPIEVLQEYADEELRTLVKERPIKFPSEDPVDEIIVTLSLVGHYGNPRKLTSATALSINCSTGSPIKSDIRSIANALSRLSGK